MERGGEQQIFAPLPEETEDMADVPLTEIGGLSPAVVAVLEDAGYRTFNDIIDLEREDFLRLAGIAPEEADRLMALITELTEEGGGEGEAAERAAGDTTAA
jgi:N utilization substance protein A